MTARCFCRLAALFSAAGLLLTRGLTPASAATATTNEVAELKTLVDGNSAFAFDLYARLRDRPGNLVLSPYSLSTVLAMTYAGARDNTARQMAEALHFNLEPARLHPVFGGLQRRLAERGNREGVELTTANSLWVQKGYPLLASYTNLCQQAYGGLAWPVDLASAPDAACRIINNWIAARTRRRITGLVQPEHLTADTSLVLVNAVFFKGQWLSRFWRERTRPAPFHVTADKTVDTPMMVQQRVLGYGKADGMQVLVMRYRGQRFSMVVLLPEQVDGLAKLEETLNLESLKRWVEAVEWQEIVALVPRFKIASEFQLVDCLKRLGISEAFDGKTADFSGINGQKGLFLQLVVQQALIEVEEEGTVAAAATGGFVALGEPPQPPPPPVFRADHPFLFLIMDRETHTVLFIGRVADPSRS